MQTITQTPPPCRLRLIEELAERFGIEQTGALNLYYRCLNLGVKVRRRRCLEAIGKSHYVLVNV